MRHRGDADIAGELAPVVEAAIEYLPCKDAGEVLANASDARECRDCMDRLILCSGSEVLRPLRLDLSDEFKRQNEPTVKAVEFGTQVRRQFTAVTGP